MDSDAPQGDALKTFLARPLQDQLKQVALRTVRFLREINRLHAQAVKRDQYPTMERQVELAVRNRIADVVDQLEGIIPLSLAEQLGRINALTIKALDDLHETYLAWCLEYDENGLHALVHARMLERLEPDEHEMPRARDIAAAEAGLAPDELEARLALRLDHETVNRHTKRYARAEERGDVEGMARLTAALLAKRKD